MTAVLRSRARRIDFDEGEPDPVRPEPSPEMVQYPIDPALLDIPITFRAGEPISPAYMVIFDRDGRPICRTALADPPRDLRLMVGETLTITATLRID